MPEAQTPRYFGDPEEREKYNSQLKLTRCLFCKATGYLNRHGYLKGYSDQSPNATVIRGYRYFCSNRNKRRGCGRTYSVLLAEVLRRCVVSATVLWRFVKALSDGACVRQAWRQLDSTFSLSAAYSWKARLRRALPHLRTRLHPLAPVPPCMSRQPLVQTMQHLVLCFPSNPITAFQHHFQRPFFA